MSKSQTVSIFRRLLFVQLFVMVAFSLFSQSSEEAYIIIKDIQVKGNKQTKKHVVLKELDFSIGDKIYTKDIQYIKEVNEKRLLSTALFTGVSFNITEWNSDKTAVITITVRENWYWYPTPILETGDRNFNVWFFEENRSLDRINYGLSLQNINLTGNGDLLKFKAQRGYNDKLELHYSYPYLGKKIGMRGQVFYGSNDEISYTTRGNKLIFGRNAANDKMLTRRRLSLGLMYRETTKSRHTLDFYYRNHSTPQYVVDSLTTDFFANGARDMQWFSMRYKWQYDNRLYNFYPEGGWYTSIEILKDGFGILTDLNVTTIKLDYQKYFRHNPKLSSGIRLGVGAKIFDGKIPYYFNKALGYEDDVVRGYELYVVDGNRWALGKYSIRYQLLQKEVNLGRSMFIKKLKRMPLSIYLRANAEAGYVYDGQYAIGNPINDGIMYGGGPAVDFILYYSFMASFEYNINKNGESGIFLKSTFNF